MKKLLLVISILTAFSAVSLANGDYGTPGEFLNWGAGARSLGMGKAFTGLADDASAVYYNPAGLAQQNPYQLTLMHVILYEDTMYDFAAASVPFSGVGTFGLAYVRLGSSNFDGRSELWEARGNFDISNQAIFVSYARDIVGSLSAGINLKVIMESVYDKSGAGYGADLGLMFVPSEYVSFGLSVINLLPPAVKLDTLTETFPMVIKFGIAGKFLGERIIPTLDVEKEMSNKGLKFKMGLEVYPINDLAIRAGLDETEITFGAGYKFLKNYKVDYSLSSQELSQQLGVLGMTHRVSFTFMFGGFDVNVSAEPKIFSPVGTRKNTTLTIYASTKYPITEWELNIINEDDDVVRSYSGDDNPPASIIWDGKDDRGLPVSDGEYKCVMKAIDKNGKVNESGAESVKISSSLLNQPGTIELEE
ncbi:MAG: hypothetical protein CVV21_01800 [Candidatus Goldiibacteriota bacterium HGW-Goldbacteria-1]|jgi:hypothetical protein|nr:MAG: hypothetical protein CVV21_01800 [Candidatus Goldiibacteriota bacterium HGW-Goldbacteria-1]